MKKFVSKMLAGALGLSMLCGVAAAEGETYVSWYTFGDVYLSSVRTALDAAMEAKGLTVVDKDSNANQQTQTDDINTALVTGANAVVVNLVESGAIGTAETLMNAIKEKDVLFLDGVHQGFGGADSAGLNQVHDHSVRAGNQSGVDIVGLGLLVRVGILVNDRQALGFHRRIQRGTHAGEIHVAERVPGHIGFTLSSRDAAQHGQAQRAGEHLGNKLFHGKHLFFLFQRDSSH